jgi:hypothetical protein
MPYLNKAQHVPGDSPPIIRSLKLHKQPLDLHTWKVIGRAVVGLCQVALVDFQLDAQNSYLFIYNTSIKILYMFRTLPCSSSGGLRRKECSTFNGEAIEDDVDTLS